MAFALHNWTREPLLARLAANDAIDAAASVDATAAARDRLRLLGVSDRLEAAVLPDDEAITAFATIRDDAWRTAGERVGAVAETFAD